MLLARIINLGYVLCRVARNILLIPYFLLRSSHRFVDVYLRTVVDATLNLDLIFKPAIESLDLYGLQRLINGPPPDLHLKFDNRYGNINFLEGVAISYLVQAMRPKVLFEIGTFDGFGSYH